MVDLSTGEGLVKRQLALSIVAGAAIGQLGWFDPLFIPLVLAGPLVTGAVAGSRRLPLAPVAATWFFAGVAMLVGDRLVNHEDVAFHAVLAVVMAGLATAGCRLGARYSGRGSVGSSDHSPESSRRPRSSNDERITPSNV